MTVRTLIVDDEPLARERLQRLLRADARLEIVGECADGESAIRALRELQPELVLLDIQMPEMDGFEVLERVDAPLPKVIFVTAYDSYAIRAFEVNAVDYVLKPVDPARLARAIDRALSEHVGTAALEQRISAVLQAVRPAAAARTRLVVHEGNNTFLLPVRDIDWVEAAGNYVKVHAKGKTYLQREPLKDIEARLDPGQFVRVNRSAIVNLDAVERIQAWFRGEYQLFLRDGSQLTSSRAYGQAFRTLLEAK
jgi:two-component system LytT family response regulator